MSGLIDIPDQIKERGSESESATNEDSSDNQTGGNNHHYISEGRPLTPMEGGPSKDSSSSMTPKHKLNNSSSSLAMKKSNANKKARHR